MRKEGKTFYSSSNQYLVSKIAEVQSRDLSKYNGRFVRVLGKIKNINTFGKDAKLIFLYYKRMKKDLLVISFENQLKWLGLDKTSKNDYLQFEGYATLYKQKQSQISPHPALFLD